MAEPRGNIEGFSAPGRNRRRMLMAAGILVAAVGITGGVVAGIRNASERAAREAEEKAIAEQARIAEERSRAVADCNRYAAQTGRDTGRVVKHGVVGGAVGAGVGAVGGAIVGGHHSVGKGAGLGALLGATAGTLHGLSEENRRSEQARAAYQECMARAGY